MESDPALALTSSSDSSKPQGVQTFDGLRISDLSRTTLLRQMVPEGRILPIEEIAEDVEFLLVETRAYFHAGDDFDAKLRGRLHGLGNAIHDVVIRDGHGRDARLMGQVHDFHRRQAAVGEGGYAGEDRFVPSTGDCFRAAGGTPVKPLRQAQSRLFGRRAVQ